MGYVRHTERIDNEFLLSGRYEIEHDGKRHAARAHVSAPYDPKRERILA